MNYNLVFKTTESVGDAMETAAICLRHELNVKKSKRASETKGEVAQEDRVRNRERWMTYKR